MKATTCTLVGLAALLCGCQPAAPETKVEAQASEAPSVPSDELKQTFAGCTWGTVVGAGASIDAFSCPPDKGGRKLVADEALPGFVFEAIDGDGQPMRSVAVRFFSKPADAPVTAIESELATVSPGVANAGCKLVPLGAEAAASLELPVGTAFVWEPVGAVKDAWDVWNSPSDDPQPGEPPAPPCGELGPQMVGLKTFQQLTGDPSRVAMVEWGSEIQPFQFSSLRAR